MNRRDMLRAAGAAAALALLPRDARAAWRRLGAGHRPADGLSEAQLALVAALADRIIPRTDTPGASDVGVTAWVNLIVSEYYTDAERTPFLAGLDAIDAKAQAADGAPFARLAAEGQERMMVALDRPPDRQAVEARAFARLKGLVVHGYFTSERVQKEVLRTEIMPGRFDGAAPMAPARRGG